METSSRTKAKPLSVIAIIALVILVVVIDMRRRTAENQLEQVSMRLEQVTGGGNQAQNKETAMRIVADVRRLYALPEDVEPTVATIVDVNELRKRNAFYNKAENGDYLIVTTDRAILYDADKNIILDVVPVQIQPAAADQQPAQ